MRKNETDICSKYALSKKLKENYAYCPDGVISEDAIFVVKTKPDVSSIHMDLGSVKKNYWNCNTKKIIS